MYVYVYDHWSYSCQHEQKGRVMTVIPGVIWVFNANLGYLIQAEGH